MKYTVGEVAKLLGFTPNALRFYDKAALLEPERSESGRRFYDQLDLTRLLSCKKYSAMGIPLKVVLGQFSEGGDRWDVVAERLIDCEQSAREKAAYYANLADSIAEHSALMAEIKARCGEITIETSPTCLLLFDPEHQLMSRDGALVAQMRRWIDAMPATKLAAVYLSEGPYSGSATLSYAIRLSAAERAGLSTHEPGVIVAPAKPSLHVVCSHYDVFQKPELAFESAFAYMKEKQLQIDGTPWAQFIVVESDEHYTHNVFVDAWVPFKL